MNRAASFVWVVSSIVVLVWGVVVALTGHLTGGTGWGPLWYFSVIAMAFPSGAVFLLVGSLLLALVELRVLGTDTYFAPIAQVCLAWSAAFAGGLAQRAMIRRWRERAVDPNGAADAT
jgi:hypothetical protein